MIRPASRWFEIAELPVVTQLHRQSVNCKELLIADKNFDKNSEHIGVPMEITFLDMEDKH